MQSIIEYFENTVAAYPEKIAIEEEQRQISFAELQKQARALSIYMERVGISRPAAIFLPKQTESIVSIISVLYSGNFYVPLDIKTPPERLKSIINNLQPAYIITFRQFEAILKNASISLRQIIFLDEIDLNKEAHIENLPEIIETDPIYTIYTSGSTGAPKGVVISHRGVQDYITWAIDTYHIHSDINIGNQAPLYFDNSTLDLYLMLFTGATLHIIPEMLFSFPPKIIDYLNHKKINCIFWVPSILSYIANSNILEQIQPQNLTHILFAGEVMPAQHLLKWQKALPEALYSNLYGPTEITVDCTYSIIDRLQLPTEPVPIGQACRNSRIYLIKEGNQEAKKGEPGEIYVGGPGLALGYLNNQEATDKSFSQNPLHDDYPERLYKTGDLAYYNDRDELIFAGRKDHQIKHMGYRIEPGEIEHAILHIEEITECCVVYDNRKRKITAFYGAMSPGNIAKFRKTLMPFIPKYMIPNKWIHLNHLPKNKNQKIDRKALKQKLGEDN